jgi:hypothetical protein
MRPIIILTLGIALVLSIARCGSGGAEAAQVDACPIAVRLHGQTAWTCA